MATTPPSHFRRMKLLFLTENLGKDVLTFILRRDTHIPTTLPGVSLHQYLNQLTPDNSTANYVRLSDQEKRKTFNMHQMHLSRKCPLWNNLDTSLLYKAIKLACEGVATLGDDKWKDQNEMEGMIKEIKDVRNATIHAVEPMTEAEFQAKVDKLMHLFIETLYAAKARYKVPDTEFVPIKDKAFWDIIRIRQMEDEISKEYWKAMRPVFILESQRHLKDLYRQYHYSDPLSFLSGSPQSEVHVHSVSCSAFYGEQKEMFRKIDAGETYEFIKTDAIESYDILTLTQPKGRSARPPTSSRATPSTQGKKSHLIIVQGVAGSGKTSLLTFIASEWLKDIKDCSVKHLNEYDIVLLIFCWEINRPSRQDLIKQRLPDFFAMMEEYLVIFLKECKVLFLIDDLHELKFGNPTKQLVTNIMKIGNEVPGFNIIGTTQPKPLHLIFNTIPNSYQLWMVCLGSNSPHNRTDLVLRHYNSLPYASNKDPDSLRHLMNDTAWKHHFGLPLNLFFVATLFYTYPNCLRNSITNQTCLYFNIHKWCVQKLRSRLAGHPGVRRDRQDHKDGISRVLEVIYNIALKGLLHARLNLSEQETQCLRDMCQAEKLPTKEVMGAFLCLQETASVNLAPHQRYFLPHKSLQEFYSAKYIICKLMEDPCTGSIRRLLKYPFPVLDRCHQNLLLHVLGLLSQPDTPHVPEAIQEVVDLLVECGVETLPDWLTLLADGDINRTALERIATHIKYGSGETIFVTDSTVIAANTLLPLVSPRKVQIHLYWGKAEVVFQACAHHTFTELYLLNHYHRPCQAAVLDSLLHSLPRSHIAVFVGHLSADGVMLLKDAEHLELLRLAVSDNQDAHMVLPAIGALCSSLPRLRYFDLHVPVYAVEPEALKVQLPDCCLVSLVLSGVDETVLQKAWCIAAALQPGMTGRYWRIKFPGCNMKANVWRRFLDKLVNAGVRVMASIVVSDTSPITKMEEKELKNRARKRKLGGFQKKEWSEPSEEEIRDWSTLW